MNENFVYHDWEYAITSWIESISKWGFFTRWFKSNAWKAKRLKYLADLDRQGSAYVEHGADRFFPGGDRKPAVELLMKADEILSRYDKIIKRTSR